MPGDKKARHLASFPAVSELVAARLLVAYHLVHQRPMMGAFLDAVGIAHENGMIADEEVKAPEPEALRKAATAIAGQFPGRRRGALSLARCCGRTPTRGARWPMRPSGPPRPQP